MAIRPLHAPAAPWTPERARTASADGLARFASAITRHFGYVDSLLDVGAGSGQLAAALGAWCGRYVGLDQMPNDGVRLGDAHRLPFDDEAFDVVVSKQTLPHLANPRRAIAELRRVARRGVVIQQEFPADGVGWPGHSLVRIDSPDDVLELLPGGRFNGIDFVWRRA
jgi:SAM-dependent methyltransferase